MQIDLEEIRGRCWTTGDIRNSIHFTFLEKQININQLKLILIYCPKGNIL